MTPSQHVSPGRHVESSHQQSELMQSTFSLPEPDASPQSAAIEQPHTGFDAPPHSKPSPKLLPPLWPWSREQSLSQLPQVGVSGVVSQPLSALGLPGSEQFENPRSQYDSHVPKLHCLDSTLVPEQARSHAPQFLLSFRLDSQPFGAWPSQSNQPALQL
jgi:hypothetical protein